VFYIIGVVGKMNGSIIFSAVLNGIRNESYIRNNCDHWGT